MKNLKRAFGIALAILAATVPCRAQQSPSAAAASSQALATPPRATVPSAAPAAAPLPAGYVIGPEDVLEVIFWRDNDMSAEVTVRPDGRITLPLLNEIEAANLTPDQLREKVTAAAVKFMEDPSVTVLVKQINSRKVSITGSVAKPGQYSLGSRTTVLQLISMAGGLQEFANSKRIIIVRTDANGRQLSYKFNYKDVAEGKNLRQNIELKPGDTVIVP